MKYIVAGIPFRTKADLTKHCSTLLAKGTVDDAADAFMRALLERHPERDQKVGCGIARIFIAPDNYGGRCFWLERLDGSRTDFSFKSCITAPSHESDVRQALRDLITSQIIAFRDNAFLIQTRIECALTKALIASDEAHVDHRPPKTFLALMRSFLVAENLNVADVRVEPTKDGVTSRELLDRALAERWQTYHREQCELQIVARRANLSQGSGR